MSYRFLEDVAIADMAFEIEANTLPDLFSEATEALLDCQIQNPQDLRQSQRVTIEVFAAELDMLLYRFLQELVYYKDVKRWLLRAERVAIREAPEGFKLTADLTGEVLDPGRHEQRADVKAVTMHRLDVQKINNGWKATVVVDV